MNEDRYNPNQDYCGPARNFQSVPSHEQYCRNNPEIPENKVDTKRAQTAYSCPDEYKMGSIQDNQIYIATTDDQHDQIAGGKHVDAQGGLSGYFSDQATVDTCKTGGALDNTKYNEMCQIAPYREGGLSGQGEATYKPHIDCFKIDRDALYENYETYDFNAAVAKCEANNQFGLGGGNQGYNPYISEMIDNGTLKYDSNRSYSDSGISNSNYCNPNALHNSSVSEADYKDMLRDAQIRAEDCVKNDTPHPSTEACNNGYPKNDSPISSETGNATPVKPERSEDDSRAVNTAGSNKGTTPEGHDRGNSINGDTSPQQSSDSRKNTTQLENSPSACSQDQNASGSQRTNQKIDEPTQPNRNSSWEASKKADSGSPDHGGKNSDSLNGAKPQQTTKPGNMAEATKAEEKSHEEKDSEKEAPDKKEPSVDQNSSQKGSGNISNAGAKDDPASRQVDGAKRSDGIDREPANTQDRGRNDHQEGSRQGKESSDDNGNGRQSAPSSAQSDSPSKDVSSDYKNNSSSNTNGAKPEQKTQPEQNAAPSKAGEKPQPPENNSQKAESNPPNGAKPGQENSSSTESKDQKAPTNHEATGATEKNANLGSAQKPDSPSSNSNSQSVGNTGSDKYDGIK